MVMMGVGASIGAGVFVLLGQGAAMAGPSIIFGLLLSGIINLFAIFSYCELGASLPETGGERIYVKVAFGGSLGFITGWFEWLSEMFYAVVMALSAAILLSKYSPIENYVSLVAVLFLAIFTLINLKGVKASGRASVMLGMSLLLILAVYVISGWLHGFRPNAFEPFMPNGFFATMNATAFLYIVYLGSEDIVIAQGEVKNPGKTIPRALIMNSLLLILIYTVVSYVTIGLVPYNELGNRPLTKAAEQALGEVGSFVITAAGLVAALSSLNTALMAQSRVIYSMGLEGYFPKFLGRVHKQYGIPYAAVLFSFFFTFVFTVMKALEFATYASSFGFLVGYFLTNLALVKLRRTKPHLERPFKAPLYPLTSVVSIFAIFMLLAFIEPSALALGIEFGIIGIIAYYISMLGYHRIRIALGGISLGVGFFVLISAYLLNARIINFEMLLIPLELATFTFCFIVVLGAILIFLGILSILKK